MQKACQVIFFNKINSLNKYSNFLDDAYLAVFLPIFLCNWHFLPYLSINADWEHF